MKNKLLVITVILVLTGACRQSDQQVSDSGDLLPNDASGLVVADTIIYDVIINNPNPDDAWAAHCLAGLNHSMLIDSIFEMVHTGKAMAFNHETGERLTPKQVDNMESEAGFKRDDISMIQFTEVWYLNPGNAAMTKEVLSMVLGYNYYTAKHELIGHKALFRVEL